MTMSAVGRLWRRVLLTTIALLVVAIGCGFIGTRSERSESETHFLTRCDGECGEGLSCACGVCTQSCKSSDSCRGLSQLADCKPIEEDLCGQQVAAICDVACTGDEDCRGLGWGFGCTDGACRQVSSVDTKQSLQTPGAAGSPGSSTSLGTAGAAGGGSEGTPIDAHFTPSTGSDGEFCAFDGAACEPENSGVEFVVDLGAAMLAPGEDGDTLFGAARASLEHYVEYANVGQVGLTFFPNLPTQVTKSETEAPQPCIDSSLDVPMAPVDGAQRERLLAALVDAYPHPGARSPLLDAYRLAVEKWRAHPEVGVKIIAVVTAGAASYDENCLGTGSEQEDLSTWYGAIGEAYAEGIKTLVFGPNGDDGATEAALSQAARGGNGFQCGCAVDSAGCTCSDEGPEYCHNGLLDDKAQVIGQLVQRYGCPERDPCSRQFELPAELQTLGPEAVAVRVWVNGEPQLVRTSENQPCDIGYYAQQSEGTVRMQLCEQTCALAMCLPGPVEWGFHCEAPLSE